MIYKPTPVPTVLSKQLLSWLQREMQSISNAFLSTWDMPITTQAPEKALAGNLRFADGVGWNPGAGQGVYVYTGSAWVKL